MRTGSLSKEEELLISNLRAELKDDFIDRSFNASFRDYLITSLITKMEELELRRMKIRLTLKSSKTRQL
jgi:hypothetical protein